MLPRVRRPASSDRVSRELDTQRVSPCYGSRECGSDHIQCNAGMARARCVFVSRSAAYGVPSLLTLDPTGPSFPTISPDGVRSGNQASARLDPRLDQRDFSASPAIGSPAPVPAVPVSSLLRTKLQRTPLWHNGFDEGSSFVTLRVRRRSSTCRSQLCAGACRPETEALGSTDSSRLGASPSLHAPASPKTP
jgi:hypothetical protein